LKPDTKEENLQEEAQNEASQSDSDSKPIEVKRISRKREKEGKESELEASQSAPESPMKISLRGRKIRGVMQPETNDQLQEQRLTEIRRTSLSPSIAESMFECLKCGTKIMQTKDLVLNHLKRHKLTLDQYIDTYSDDGNPEKISALLIWKHDRSTSNENSPIKKGTRRGGRTFSKPDSEENSEVAVPEMKVEKKSSPFKLLFSTVGTYYNEPVKEDIVEEPEIKLSKIAAKEETVNSTPEKVEPDSTTSSEDVVQRKCRKTPRSSKSSKKSQDIKAEDQVQVIKYTDKKGSEVKWIQGKEENEMPEVYIGGQLHGKVDLKEIEHALEQNVQIPDKFREMLPSKDEKDEESKRIVLRIKKVKS